MAWLPTVVMSAITLLLVQGCGTAPTRLDAVPSALTAKAEIPGMPGVRYVGGRDMTELRRVGLEALQREQDYLTQQGSSGSLAECPRLQQNGNH
jgi:hypothetical protein